MAKIMMTRERAEEVKAKGFVFSYIARRSSSDFDV